MPKRELKPDSGTVTEQELFGIFADFDVKLPEDIEFPFSQKLTKQHTLLVDRRSSLRVTTEGFVPQFNWLVTENMRNDVRRE